jgi:hypothetical protein
MTKRTKWIVCPVCHGNGTTVNPNIDAHGPTAEDFAEDPDFAEDYCKGMYDVTCRGCQGVRVVTRQRIKELRQHAEDRRLAAQEDGDYESFSVAGDWRFG